MNRRKRLSRPKTLVFFGLVLLLLPIINYYSISAQTGIGFFFFRQNLAILNSAEIFLLFASIPVAVGLLLVKRWGWWLFFLYSALLIGYNGYLLALSKNLFDLGVLVRTFIGVGTVIYFSRKDISAPYFKMYPRGWRYQKRKPVELAVIIEGRNYKTKDVSSSGIYVESDDLNYEINSELKIQLKLDSEFLELTVGVVRIDSKGMGMAFRNLSPEQRELLEKIN
ncbi:MAG TPA: PilZ domain-containing protein [Leptospiraceae bacterium]|nr:PilZ domain-containing protein [Leptospiraceae bacterium]HMY65056.1 PilZ domain-containing protein [Leptospiraceae bacterium]HNF16932.1 PilZ domain-containing protein [Leptospiraceae bacterium]HNF23346.1 PilZ domain-containing protein [Leptospiraceae bacterium]HNI96355.1 PilZ domain-containing protein [Leptospiraceae bacterium]